MGRCWAFTRNIHRCRRQRKPWNLFCSQYRLQWIPLFIFLVFTFGGGIASYLGLLCPSFGIYCGKTNNDLAEEYLNTAINYKKDGNVEKMLENCLKAYEANKNTPDVIFYTAYSYLLNQDPEKTKDILISNFDKLGEQEKVLLGIVEEQLKNYSETPRGRATGSFT